MSPRAGRPAGFARRLAASAYEGLLVGALLFLVGFALLPAVSPAADSMPTPTGASRALYMMSPAARRLSAIALFAASGVYCAWLWSSGRRTLAMRTWRLALRTAAGAPVGLPRAVRRYVACWAGPVLAIGGYVALQPLGHGRWALGALAFNYAWGLVDPDRQFFQDRVAGTQLIVEGSNDPRKA